MPVTRQGPVVNMDTQQPLILRNPRERFTRGAAHRLLRLHKVNHDPGGSMDYMLNLLALNNISISIPQPGMIEPPKKEKPAPVPDAPGWADAVAEDGYPKHIGRLKRMCKDRGIKAPVGANRKTLVKLLKEYVEKL